MSLESTYLDNIPEDKKREVAFNLLVSVRDAISIAQKQQSPPTYEQALRIVHDVDETLYEFCSVQLSKKNENDTVKLYKELATVETLKQGKSVLPEDLLAIEVKRFKDILNVDSADKKQMKSVKHQIATLESAIENLKPRKLSEHRILERDFCKVDRKHLGAEKIFENDKYVDYRTGNDRFLRIRLLHPDKPEHIIGADLIYEQYDVESEKLRMALLQYKTWDNGVLYVNSSNNLEAQLNKLSANICEKGFCTQPTHLAGQLDYRFPYCCAYLRPTDRLQRSNSKLISHGVHIPVCSALKIKEDNENKIEKKHIRHSTLTHEVFENLFNHGFIGSRWIEYSEIEDFYKERKVLDDDESLKIYAKEIIGNPKGEIDDLPF